MQTRTLPQLERPIRLAAYCCAMLAGKARGQGGLYCIQTARTLLALSLGFGTLHVVAADAWGAQATQSKPGVSGQNISGQSNSGSSATELPARPSAPTTPPPTTPPPTTPPPTFPVATSPPAPRPRQGPAVAIRVPLAEIVADPTRIDLNAYTSRALARFAMLDLRAQDDATPDDYRVAAALLDAAQSLALNDIELLRRRIEAHFNAGNDKVVLALSRDLLRLDPKDTVTQLRIITARLAQMQTVEERMVAYARFLGPEGNAFDPSVKSRLALDAALLAREMGEEAKFLTLLEQAATLDPSNKAAALMAFTVFAGSVDSASGRLELLANLLHADPMDPRVHQQIRDELASVGAFTQARRFHTSASAILNAAIPQEDPSRAVIAFVLTWYCDGPRKPLDTMLNQLVIERDRADRTAKAQEDATGIVTVKRGKDVRLSLPNEIVRLTSAMAVDDKAQIEASLTDLAASIAEREEVYNDRGRRPVSMTDQDAALEIGTLKGELIRWRLLTNSQLDAAAAGYNQALSMTEPESQERATLLALSALRSGDTASSLYFCSKATQPSPWVELIRGMAHALAGDDQASRLAYAEAFRIAPLGLLGALGHTLAARVEVHDPDHLTLPPATSPAHDVALAAALNQYAATIPAWIDQMVTNPHSFQNMAITINQSSGLGISTSNRADPLAPLRATIKITNVSPVALGFGTDRTINPRLLFAPNLEGRRGNQRATAEPEVVELAQRLRLLPGETMEYTANLDYGTVAFISELHSEAPTQLWWRVMQGFESRSGGVRDVGAGCLEAVTDTLARGALPEATRTPESIAQRLAAITSDANAQQELPALLIAARGFIARSVDPFDSIAPDARFTGTKALCDAIIAAYPSWPATSRVLAITTLPPAKQIPELARLDELILNDIDPFVRPIAIVARAQTSDSPAIESALASEDPALVRIAKAHQSRLASGGQAFGERGFGQAFPTKAVDSPAGESSGARRP